MMRNPVILAVVGLLALSIPANAQDSAPRNVADLIGARAAGGETQLRARGYEFVKSQRGSDRIWSNWWNAQSRTCLSVVTSDGRYNSIVTAPALDCEQSENFQNVIPSGFSDLVGVRASGGEAQLQSRGFEFIRTQTGSDRRWSYWWNRQTQTCINVVTYDGRYSSITDSPAHDCNQQAHPAANPDVPEISFRSGEGMVRFANGCMVYYNERGNRTRSTRNCNRGILYQADAAMASYRREQGMDGPVADHNAPAHDAPRVAFARGQGTVRFDNGCRVNYDVEVRPISNTNSCTRDQLYEADNAVWEARLRLNTDIPLPEHRYHRN